MENSQGYVTQVIYPAHFHREMTPQWLVTLATLKGLKAPALDASFAYCELGCGVGINLLIAAACHPQGQFVGVDINAEHIAYAQQAASEMKLSNVRFIQADFASFAQSNALFFDFIACHGVWSWVAPSVQQQLLNVVRRSLKPEGLFYLQYMSHPGSSSLQSVQKLVLELSHTLTGTPVQNVSAGVELAAKLDKAGFFHDQPQISTYVQQLQALDKAYLVHELLTEHWQPQHSPDVLRQVAGAGLQFLDSANVFDFLEVLSIPRSAQTLVANARSVTMREQLKDLARHQLRRQDLFQKGPQPLTSAQGLEAVQQLHWQLLPGAPASGGLQFKTPVGVIDGPSEMLSPLLERLTQGTASTAQLAELAPFKDAMPALLQSLLLLMWQGVVHPCQIKPVAVAQAVVQDWLDRQQLGIDLVASCATAAPRVVTN